MAEKEPEKVVMLTEERKQQLRKSLADMKSIEGSLKALDKTGLDTSPLRERLQWAKEMSEVLLSEF